MHTITNPFDEAMDLAMGSEVGLSHIRGRWTRV